MFATGATVASNLSFSVCAASDPSAKSNQISLEQLFGSCCQTGRDNGIGGGAAGGGDGPRMQDEEFVAWRHLLNSNLIIEIPVQGAREFVDSVQKF